MRLLSVMLSFLSVLTEKAIRDAHEARPWAPRPTAAQILAARPCTCCQHGARVIRDAKGAARESDLLLLDLKLPSTAREIRNLKARKRRARRSRALEDRVLRVFGEYDDGLKPSFVAEMMGERVGVARSVMGRLEGMGELVREDGYWFRKSRC